MDQQPKVVISESTEKQGQVTVTAVTVTWHTAPLFETGRMCITPGAAEVVSPLTGIALIARHCRGDWSELDEHDRQQNQQAVENGDRVLSTYTVGEGKDAQKVYVITEWDRSVTTILLPSEY